MPPAIIKLQFEVPFMKTCRGIGKKMQLRSIYFSADIGYGYIPRYMFIYIYSYPMLSADSRFWLVNNREI